MAPEASGSPFPAEAASVESVWLIWQLVDSAFPTGGFAHSGGLEAAYQQGEIRGNEELRAWIIASLRQIQRSSLPLARATHLEPSQFLEWDGYADAFLSNHVANRASRKQGHALLAAAKKVFNLSPPESPTTDCAMQSPRCGHLAPSFGWVTRTLGLGLTTAFRLFVFHHLRSVVGAAVRLNRIGPVAGQVMQRELGDIAENIVQNGLTLGMDDLAQTAPLLELWQSRHDRLYSRLFQT